jgi:cytochrome P450
MSPPTRLRGGFGGFCVSWRTVGRMFTPMTESTLVFDPFSQEFFDDPYKFYRWMPVYYSDQYDFYALTRHEDVAAAYKNYGTCSSAYGVDLAMVQSGGPPPDVWLM